MRLAQSRHWTVVGGLDDEWSFSRIGPSLTQCRRQPGPWRMPDKMAFGSAHYRSIRLETGDESTASSSPQDQHDGTSILGVVTVPIKPRTIPGRLLNTRQRYFAGMGPRSKHQQQQPSTSLPYCRPSRDGAGAHVARANDQATPLER